MVWYRHYVFSSSSGNAREQHIFMENATILEIHRLCIICTCCTQFLAKSLILAQFNHVMMIELMTKGNNWENVWLVVFFLWKEQDYKDYSLCLLTINFRKFVTLNLIINYCTQVWQQKFAAHFSVARSSLALYPKFTATKLV